MGVSAKTVVARIRGVRRDARERRLRRRLLGVPPGGGDASARRRTACSGSASSSTSCSRSLASSPRSRSSSTSTATRASATTLPALIVIPAFAVAPVGDVAEARRRASSRAAQRLAPGASSPTRWPERATCGSLLASPREHGLGVLGNVMYWAGDIGCLWAALALCGSSITPGEAGPRLRRAATCSHGARCRRAEPASSRSPHLRARRHRASARARAGRGRASTASSTSGCRSCRRCS